MSSTFHNRCTLAIVRSHMQSFFFFVSASVISKDTRVSANVNLMEIHARNKETLILCIYINGAPFRIKTAGASFNFKLELAV